MNETSPGKMLELLLEVFAEPLEEDINALIEAELFASGAKKSSSRTKKQQSGTRERKKRTRKDKSAEQLSLALDQSSEEPVRERRRRVIKDSSSEQLTSSVDKSPPETETRARGRRVRQDSSIEQLTSSVDKSPPETETRERGRRVRQDSSTDKWSNWVKQGLIDPETGERRRRVRGDKSTSRKVEKKTIPHPIPAQQSELNNLAREMALQTAQKVLDCIPPEMKEVLSDEQLKFQQNELSASLAHTLRSQLSWALNQAWLEAKNGNEE